jgi:CubicO group peptidase (beta-lactamase class C family)
MIKQLQTGLSALFLVIGLFSAHVQAQVDTVLANELQQILDDRVQFNGNNGVSACLIMPNGDLWKGTAGVGAGSVPITDSTVFHGASITKTHVATLLLMLAQDGLLHLDSTWDTYVSLNAGFDTTITIRQLINHTSGIKDYLEVAATENYVTNDFNYAYTPVEILENIVNDTPDFAPGTNFSYSTSNYVLAALIAETVTGNPVQQELRDRIWDTLGLSHTYFGGFEAYTEPRAGVWWNFGSGLTNYSNDPETSMLTYGYGGANIVSTPEDLARFARALFVDSLLSPAAMAEMQVFVPQSYTSWTAGYGLGIHNASSWGNNSVLGHDGYYTNMADMFHSHDYGFTLVTMTNTATQWVAIFDEMYDAVRDHILATGDVDGIAAESLKLFPNPVRERLMVDLGGVYSDVRATVVDMAGKTIFSNVFGETKSLEVDVKDFAAGMYVLQVQAEDFRASKRFVVEQ